MTTEHRCVCCPQLRQGEPRIYERAQVCEGCRARLRSMLAEVVELYQDLDLEKGSASGQRVSGSRTPPLPLRVDPLDLSLPAPTGRQRWEPNNWPRDQVGHISVATLLDSWVRDWIDVLGLRETPPALVGTMAGWLTNRIDLGSKDHPAIDDFAAEIRDLLQTLRRTVGTSEVRPEHLDVPCRRCDLLDLHRLPGEDRVECGSCGDLLTEDEYRRWVGLVAAEHAHA